jgi:hypothetical protein
MNQSKKHYHIAGYVTGVKFDDFFRKIYTEMFGGLFFRDYCQFSITQCIAYSYWWSLFWQVGRLGRDSMVVGFITTYVISAYHH